MSYVLGKARITDHFSPLVRIAEKGFLPTFSNGPWPKFADVISHAAVFQFQGRAHERLTQEALLRVRPQLTDQFRLPFANTAIMDSASVVLLGDTEPDQCGLHGVRRFLECEETQRSSPEEYYSQGNPSQTIAGKAMYREQFGDRKDGRVCLVRWGTFAKANYSWSADKAPDCIAVFNLEGLAAVSASGRITPWRINEEVRRLTASNIRSAFEEVATFWDPEAWMVEERLLRHVSDKRPLRLHERPIHYVLTKLGLWDLLRERGINPPKEAETECNPHCRKAHPRTYKHPKYAASGLLGTTQFVRRCWVGPDRFENEKRSFRVLLEKYGLQPQA